MNSWSRQKTKYLNSTLDATTQTYVSNKRGNSLCARSCTGIMWCLLR